eukprot:6176949-Pleurochrysis_carterae.AAC.1
MLHGGKGALIHETQRARDVIRGRVGARSRSLPDARAKFVKRVFIIISHPAKFVKIYRSLSYAT